MSRETPPPATRSRRHRGQPAIRRRADGRWWVRLELPHVDAHGRRRKDLYGRSAREVSTKIKEFWTEFGHANVDHVSATPLKDVLDQWLTALDGDDDEKPVRSSTWIGYETHVRLHINPWLGEMFVTELGVSDVERWLKDLRRNGRSNQMRRKALGTLRTASKWAVGHKFVAENVATAARLPPKPAAKKWEPASRNEVNSILEAIKDHRLRTHFRIALMLGPRLGELNALRLEDLNHEKKTIDLHNTLTWVEGVPKAEPSKTDAGQRTIRLPDSLWADLLDHLGRREAERKAKGTNWTEYGLVFTRSNGNPLRGDGNGGVNNLFQRRLRRAGLKPRNFHQTRHIAASLLLALNGNNLVEVGQIMGHSTYRHTTDLYGHLMPDFQVEIARLLDAYYSVSPPGAGDVADAGLLSLRATA
jgi:integrase